MQLCARISTLESDQVSPVAVITHNVTADSARKHSVADVKEDGAKPTLNATIVETPTGAADRSIHHQLKGGMNSPGRQTV